MEGPEFSSQFDVLYNNITSNEAPGLNDYEKSVFLTKAEKELVKNFFSSKGNKLNEGFDDSPKRQSDFSTLIRNATLNMVDRGLFDVRGIDFMYPSDTFMVLNEQLIDTNNTYTVVPISYTTYDNLTKKPYKYPPKGQAWRLIVDKQPSTGTVEKAQKCLQDNDTWKDAVISVSTDKPYPVNIKVFTAPSILKSYYPVHQTSGDDIDDDGYLIPKTDITGITGSDIVFASQGGSTSMIQLYDFDGQYTYEIIQASGNFTWKLSDLDYQTIDEIDDSHYIFACLQEEALGKLYILNQYQNILPRVGFNETLKPYIKIDREGEKIAKVDIILNIPATKTFQSYISTYSTELNAISEYVSIDWPEITQAMEDERQSLSCQDPIFDITVQGIDETEGTIAEIIGKFDASTLTYKMRYVKTPKPIILTDLSSEYDSLSIDGISAETPCELPENLHDEILQRAVELAKIAWQGDVNTVIAGGQRSE